MPQKNIKANTLAAANMNITGSAESVQAYYALLLENIRDAIISTDQFLIIKSWNKGAEEIYGWTAAEAIGKKANELLITEFPDGTSFKTKLEICKQTGHLKTEVRRKIKSGEIIDIFISASAVFDKDGNFLGLVSVNKDITERKKMEAELKVLNLQLKAEVKQKTTELHHIFERVTDGFIALDNNWIYTHANKRIGELVQMEPADMIGKNVWELFPKAVGSATYKAFHKAMEEQVYVCNEDYFEPLDLWQENHIYPSVDGISVFIRDISSRKKYEQKIEKKNRLYFFISQINQMIVRATEQQTLFHESCNIAVTIGEFKMAWIGLISAETGSLVPVKYAGEEQGYLTSLVSVSKVDVPEGNGLIGSTLLNGNYFISNDIEQDPAMAPWKDKALQRGYCSLMALPIKKFDKVIGTFSFYAGTTHFFDEEEIALLLEATGDVSFALELFDKEADRRQTEKEIRDYKFALDKSAIVAITDQKGVIKHVNDNFCTISKYSKSELLGQDHRIINSGYHAASFIKNIWTTIAKGEIWKGELCNKTKDGNIYWVDTTIVPFLNESGKPYQYIAIRSDITEKKKGETQIRVFNDLYQNVLKATSDTIWDWDVLHDTISYNDGMYDMFGYTAFEFENTADYWRGKIHPDDILRVSNEINEAFKKTEKNVHLQYRFLTAWDDYKYIYDRSFVIYDEQSKPVRMVGAMQDITKERENEMQISKATIEAQENERNMLGRELHDNINQILVGAIISLELTRQIKVERITSYVEKSISYIGIAIDELRKLSHKLAPASFEDLSLKDVLQTLIQTVNPDNRYQIELTVSDIKKGILSHNVQINLYRICQEQLSNTIKHSGADTIWISTLLTEKTVVMRIADNGNGFDPNMPRKGIGLSNIKTRVLLLSGTCTLNTEKGKGCELIVELPF